MRGLVSRCPPLAPGCASPAHPVRRPCTPLPPSPGWKAQKTAWEGAKDDSTGFRAAPREPHVDCVQAIDLGAQRLEGAVVADNVIGGVQPLGA